MPKMPTLFPEKFINDGSFHMDHANMKWLQAELSRIFSQLTGEEVDLSTEETLHIVLAMKRIDPGHSSNTMHL